MTDLIETMQKCMKMKCPHCGKILPWLDRKALETISLFLSSGMSELEFRTSEFTKEIKELREVIMKKTEVPPA